MKKICTDEIRANGTLACSIHTRPVAYLGSHKTGRPGGGGKLSHPLDYHEKAFYSVEIPAVVEALIDQGVHSSYINIINTLYNQDVHSSYINIINTLYNQGVHSSYINIINTMYNQGVH